MKKRFEIMPCLTAAILAVTLLFCISCGYIIDEEDTEDIEAPFVPTVIPGHIESESFPSPGQRQQYRSRGITGTNAAQYFDEEHKTSVDPPEDELVWGYYTFDADSEALMRQITPQNHTLTLTLGEDTLTAEYQTTDDGTLLGGHRTEGGVYPYMRHYFLEDMLNMTQLSVLYADGEEVFCLLIYNCCTDTLIYRTDTAEWRTLDGEPPTKARYLAYDYAPIGTVLSDPICFSPDGTRLVYRCTDTPGSYPSAWYVYDRTDGSRQLLYEKSMERSSLPSWVSEEVYWYSDDALCICPSEETDSYDAAVIRVFCCWDGNQWQATEYHPASNNTASFEGAYLLETDDGGAVHVTSRLTGAAAHYTDLPQSLLPEPGEYLRLDFQCLYDHGYIMHYNAYPHLTADGSTEEILTIGNDTVFCVMNLQNGTAAYTHLAAIGLLDYKIEDTFRCDGGYLLNLFHVTEKTCYITYLPDTLFFP